MSEHPEFRVVWNAEAGEYVAEASGHPDVTGCSTHPVHALNALVLKLAEGVPRCPQCLCRGFHKLQCSDPSNSRRR